MESIFGKTLNLKSLPYLEAGSLNKVVVGLNGAPTEQSALKSYDEMGTSPHILVTETGSLCLLVDPTESCVAAPQSIVLSPHRRSPAVWVDFTGTCEADLDGIDVPGIISAICAEYGIPAHKAEPSPTSPLGGASYSNTVGVIPKADLRGHTASRRFNINFDLAAAVPVETQTEDPVVVVSVEPEPVTDDKSVWPAFSGRPLAIGSKSTKIKLIVERHGLDSVVFDDIIEDLVMQAQDAAGLETTGIIDADTWAALGVL